MSAVAELIRQAEGEGVAITATPRGTLKVRGNQDAIERLVPVLRQHKAAILAELQREALAENFQERAGILEFDAGLSRPEAEERAFQLVFCSACQHSQMPDETRPHLLFCEISPRADIKWAATPAWCDQFTAKEAG
ncbi:MAG TPA: hypothetical protein VI457_10915 [Methylococcaceae bacterium]|nr:hypothetical protein [Methylococcaceae bacterium]